MHILVLLFLVFSGVSALHFPYNDVVKPFQPISEMDKEIFGDHVPEEVIKYRNLAYIGSRLNDMGLLKLLTKGVIMREEMEKEQCKRNLKEKVTTICGAPCAKGPDISAMACSSRGPLTLTDADLTLHCCPDRYSNSKDF